MRTDQTAGTQMETTLSFLLLLATLPNMPLFRFPARRGNPRCTVRVKWHSASRQTCTHLKCSSQPTSTSERETLWKICLWNLWNYRAHPLYVATALACMRLLTNACSAEYLVVITGRESQGHLMGHEIFRATDFDILPLNPNVSVQSPPHPVETHLLALLKSHLYGGYFLYSCGQDITRRLQTQWENHDADEGKAYFEVVRCPKLGRTAPFCDQIPRQTTVSFGINSCRPG